MDNFEAANYIIMTGQNIFSSQGLNYSVTNKLPQWYIVPWAGVSYQLIMKFFAFMEPEYSSPYSQNLS